jgi:hypothetical protein
MAKPNTGYVFKDKYNRWFARTSYVDQTGKRRNVKKVARDRMHAKEVLKKILREMEDHGTKFVEAAKMTFDELANYYEETYLLKPEYINDRKVSGLRSYRDVKFRLIVLKEHFGKHKIRELSHKDIERFKMLRLRTPTKHDKQRSIAAVNRDLGALRRILNVAVANGWIVKNPFMMGKGLICVGDEKPRERILTLEEEGSSVGGV